MPEDLAAILAKGQSDLYERLVTRKHFEFTLKHELKKLRAELKHDIETVRAELKSDIATVKAELQHQLDEHKAANSQALKELELNLKHELETVKVQLETVKTKLKRDIREMEQKLTIKLGAFLAISVTVLAALIKFL